MKPVALIERYRMALEVIGRSKYTEEGSIARLALGSADPVVVLMEPPTPEGISEPEPALIEPEAPEIEPDDEPVPIDLDEIDAELDAEGEKPSAQAQAQEPKPVADQRSNLCSNLSTADRTEQVLAKLRAESMTTKQLANALNVTSSRVEQILRPLRAKDAVIAVGVDKKHNAKIWGVPDEEPRRAEEPIDVDDVFNAEHAQTRKNGIGTPEGRVLQAVRYKGGSIKDLAKRLSLSSDEVALAVRKLDREGEVRSTVAGGQVVWGAR